MSSRHTAVVGLAATLLVVAAGSYWAWRVATTDEGQLPPARAEDRREHGLPELVGRREADVQALDGATGLPAVRGPDAADHRDLHVTLVGRVVGERRFPAAGAFVRFLRHDEMETQVGCGADGRFLLEVAVPDATWIGGSLHAWVGDDRVALVSVRLDVRPGERIDVGTIQLEDATRLDVRVTHDGRPAADASVLVWIAGDSRDVALLSRADVDADGRASFARLPRGWANLHARTKEGAVGRADADIRLAAPGEPIEIRVAAPRSIEVNVVSAEALEVPVAGAEVACQMTLRTGEQSLSMLPYVPLPSIPPSGFDGRTRLAGLVPGEDLRLTATSEGFSWTAADVSSNVEEVKLALAGVPVVVIPLRRGDRPWPDEGTSLAIELMSEVGTATSVVGAVMRGGNIVVSGWQGAPAIAIAPNGDVASVLEGDADDVRRGRETEFALPRTLELRFLDDAGVPVAGVPASLWASRFDDMFRASPARRSGVDGRVRFARLPPWPVEIHAFMSPQDDWGFEFGEVDLSAGDATKDIVVGNERTVVARVFAGKVPALPSGLSISVADAIQTSAEEDPASGIVTLRVRPVDPTATEGTVLASAPASRAAGATFAWPSAGGSVAVDLHVVPAPDISIEVRALPGQKVFTQVERWHAESGRWLETLRWAGASLSAIESEGVQKLELQNGRYRLRDLASRAVSEPFDVADQTKTLRVLLDLTGFFVVRGKVVGPKGPPDNSAQVIIEGAGIDTATEYGPGIPVRGGLFEALLPPGRQYALRVWHPVLRPSMEDRIVHVEGPRDDVVLRLVEGPKVEMRILAPDMAPLSAEDAEYGSIFVRSRSLPGDAGTWFKIEAGTEGHVSASGLPLGDAEIWLDVEPFALLRLAPVRIVEGTTDLGVVQLDPGSTVLLEFPASDGRVSAVWGSAQSDTTPTFSRRAIEQDETGSHRIEGLSAGRWTLALEWMDGKGAGRESSETLTVDGRSTTTMEVGAK